MAVVHRRERNLRNTAWQRRKPMRKAPYRKAEGYKFERCSQCVLYRVIQKPLRHSEAGTGLTGSRWRLLFGSGTRGTSRCSSTGPAIGPGFGQIHLVDFSMKRATADAEFFGRSGHVAIRGCKSLGD